MRAPKRRPNATKPARRSTAAARALKAARASEARFRTITEFTPAPVIISDPDTGMIFYANRAFGEIVKQAPEKLVGTRAKPLWADPEDRARFVEKLKRDGFVRDLEVRGLTVNGEERRGLLMATPLEFDGHRAMLTCAIDVTELHRVREERAKADAQLAAILSMAPVGVVTADRALRITQFNFGAETMFGRRAAEVIGKDLSLLLPERFRESHAQQIEAFAKSPQKSRSMQQRGEIYAVRSDGSEFAVEVSIGRLESADGMIFCAILRDLTERKATEAALVLAKEAAEAANKAKSQFLANMSHELRTPLNAILGFSEIMLRETDGSIGSEKYKGYLGDIHASGTHLLHVINDVLDLAKIEAGRLVLEEDDHALSELTRASVSQVREAADRKQIALVVELADGLPLIRCDGRKIKQVFLNLLSNAIKFTPSNGRIKIKAWAGRDGVIAQVSDTGLGMKLQDIPRAFMPFVQIDGGLERKHGGTGLGLPLSRSLIEMHGGTLDLQSAPGEGTTATIRLPLGRVVSAAPKKVRAARA